MPGKPAGGEERVTALRSLLEEIIALPWGPLQNTDAARQLQHDIRAFLDKRPVSLERDERTAARLVRRVFTFWMYEKGPKPEQYFVAPVAVALWRNIVAEVTAQYQPVVAARAARPRRSPAAGKVMP
jgi:hypothetical protein